ncbi:hypothetical protein EH30_13145 [Erythrobacter sp. JL475]|nr:hypothetical protein EH30_13145 [Erythrobacter sp. JL475]
MFPAASLMTFNGCLKSCNRRLFSIIKQCLKQRQALKPKAQEKFLKDQGNEISTTNLPMQNRIILILKVYSLSMPWRIDMARVRALFGKK